jgi:hypothetical protein
LQRAYHRTKDYYQLSEEVHILRNIPRFE